MPNQSTEDYIKSIFKLSRNGKTVSTSELAKHLEIGDGSVTDMVKKLSTKKLIQYTPYRGVSLTSSGKRLALKMVRRHRLWEMFLVKFLDYKWDEIHDEAEQLEHVTSEEMEKRLDKALSFPKFDPHGDPIPNVNGEFDGVEATALAEFAPGDTVRILRVSDDDADMLHHVASIGLGLNTKLHVKKKMKFDGSMVVKIGKKEQFISGQVSNAIFVQPV